MLKQILFLLILLLNLHCFGKNLVDSTNVDLIVSPTDSIANTKIKKLQKKHLSYNWIGVFCPGFKNTKENYGFEIRCTGCIVTNDLKRNNKRVVRKINRVYGKNWFENNFDR